MALTTPPELIEIPLTAVLPDVSKMEVKVFAPVPPEAVKALEVAATPKVVVIAEPPVMLTPALMVTVVVVVPVAPKESVAVIVIA